MTANGHRVIGLTILVWAQLGAVARAEVSLSATAANNYIYRGFDLTGGRPVASAAIGYDHPSGVYFGGDLLAHAPPGQGSRLLGGHAYVGFARRAANGTSWDVGLSRVDLSPYRTVKTHVRYTQAYVGVANGPFGVRLSYAPDFPRNGLDVLYAELSAAHRPSPGWRIGGHLATQVRVGDLRAGDGRRAGFDSTLSLAREWRGGEVSVGWTAARTVADPKVRNYLTVSASAFF